MPELRKTSGSIPAFCVLAVTGLVALGSCTAVITDPSGRRDAAEPGASGDVGLGGAGSAEVPGAAAALPTCADPGAHAVPKLLRLSNEEYRNIVSDVMGVTVDREHFGAWTPIAEVFGFDTMSETRLDARGLGEQLKTSEALAQLALGSPTLTRGCPAPLTPAPPAAGIDFTWEGCGKPLVSRLAGRSFRRPLRADELGDYQRVFESSFQEAVVAELPNPFYEGLTTVVQAVLLSPSFVFKPELVPGGLDAAERSYGIASKLALFVRSSVADEELWGLAESGALLDPQLIREQAERLMGQDEERFTRSFGGQWLDFRDDASEGEALMVSMQNEINDVFRRVLSDGLPPQRLLAPGYTFVDQALATHYGLAFEVGGAPVQQVMTDARGGLLSHGAFLKRTANGSEFRRPIHRGLWTMTRLLCRELPRLDPATVEEIAESFESIDRSLPLSEQMAIHRSGSPRCLGCHGEIDPIGLALEKYDKQGLWREVDMNGHPIVSDLQLFGQHVGDPMQLASAIEGSLEYRNCVATKLLTFALNRGPLAEEGCLAQDLASAKQGTDPSLKSLAIDALLASLHLTSVAP